MEYLFRFDRPRKHQEQMMGDIYAALQDKRSIIINAPTGIGKTDASLGAALTIAMEKNLDILFLTPKISQHKIVVDALQGIRKKFGVDVNFVDLVGKQNLCVNENFNSLPKELFYTACNRAIKNGKCQFYKNVKDNENIPEHILDSVREGHNSLFYASADAGLCAYEIATKAAKTANVIIADYAHILNPSIKSAFLKKISHNLESTIVIWDEAHNITELGASYMSDALTINGIARANEELKSIGRSMDLDYLSFMINSIAKESLKRTKEAFVKIDCLSEQINGSIDSITEQLDKYALEYIESSKAKRSAILHVSNFLKKWPNEDSSIVRIISNANGVPRLSLTCLYPERVISVLKETYANVFMSATMTPLSMYAEMFDIKDSTYTRNYHSPFPKSNRIAIIDDKITTGYKSRSDLQFKNIANNIENIKKHIPGNVAVFFPSFSVLKNVNKYIKNDVILQEKNMRNVELERLIGQLNPSDNKILLGVMGGSLSEGIDYKDNTLKGVIVVGLPLAVPTLEIKARINYLNKKFDGKGDDYAYRVPAIMRVIQAAGRAIRNENDRAAIIFMDNRYKWKSYNSMITDIFDITEAENYNDAIKDFWTYNKIKYNYI